MLAGSPRRGACRSRPRPCPPASRRRRRCGCRRGRGRTRRLLRATRRPSRADGACAGPRLIQRFDDAEGRERSEIAVEVAAARHRVDVRAEEDRRQAMARCRRVARRYCRPDRRAARGRPRASGPSRSGGQRRRRPSTRRGSRRPRTCRRPAVRTCSALRCVAGARWRPRGGLGLAAWLRRSSRRRPSMPWWPGTAALKCAWRRV